MTNLEKILNKKIHRISLIRYLCCCKETDSYLFLLQRNCKILDIPIISSALKQIYDLTRSNLEVISVSIFEYYDFQPIRTLGVALIVASTGLIMKRIHDAQWLMPSRDVTTSNKKPLSKNEVSTKPYNLGHQVWDQVFRPWLQEHRAAVELKMRPILLLREATARLVVPYEDMVLHLNSDQLNLHLKPDELFDEEASRPENSPDTKIVIHKHGFIIEIVRMTSNDYNGPKLWFNGYVSIPARSTVGAPSPLEPFDHSQLFVWSVLKSEHEDKDELQDWISSTYLGDLPHSLDITLANEHPIKEDCFVLGWHHNYIHASWPSMVLEEARELVERLLVLEETL